MHRSGRILTFACLAASLFAVGAGMSHRQPVAPDRGERPAANVGSTMRDMNRSLRQLRGVLDDPAKKDENLRIINDMQAACLAAKSQKAPQGLFRDAKDEAARQEIAAAYRSHLITCMRTMLDLEQAVAEGKGDLAKARFSELAKQRDAGHDAVGLGENNDPFKPAKDK